MCMRLIFSLGQDCKLVKLFGKLKVQVSVDQSFEFFTIQTHLGNSMR